MNNGTTLSAALTDLPSRMEALKCFWTELGMSGDAGCTTWDVLDPFRDRVTMYLMRDPPDVLTAESLTAEAMLRITGQSHE
jgi:hypothetical protein